MLALRRYKVCIVCGTQYKLTVHHLTYQHFGHELIGELITACFTHHEKVHYNFLGFKLRWDEDRMFKRLVRLIHKGHKNLPSQQVLYVFLTEKYQNLVR